MKVSIYQGPDRAHGQEMRAAQSSPPSTSYLSTNKPAARTTRAFSAFPFMILQRPTQSRSNHSGTGNEPQRVLYHKQSSAGTDMGQGDATVATSSDQRNDVTAPEDEVTRVVPELEEIPTAARRGERLNPVELTDSANHESRPVTTLPPGSSGTLARRRAGDTETKPESKPTEGGQEPSHHTPARHCRRIQKQRR